MCAVFHRWNLFAAEEAAATRVPQDPRRTSSPHLRVVSLDQRREQRPAIEQDGARGAGE